jgi:GAF domain-containing protein
MQIAGYARRVVERSAASSMAEDQRHDRLVAAFARTASSIAWEGSLQVVVDQLAQEVLAVSSADSCTIGLGTLADDRWELVGAAGVPPRFLDRAAEAMAMGAPLAGYRAYRSQVEIIEYVDEPLASDPRFAPLRETAREAHWTSLVAIPLKVGDESVGVLSAFYAHGKEPSGPTSVS